MSNYPEPVQCFFIEPTDQCRVSLRRYRRDAATSAAKCSVNPIRYCNASADLDLIVQGDEKPLSVEEFINNGSWPTACICGYVFTEDDNRQVNVDRIYTSKQRAGEFNLRFPRTPGMMWDADWMPDHYKGADGRSLVVVTPDGHEWNIDGPCNNCTDPKTPHKCWCRHGEPPVLTVDKDCKTCKAGAGSIATPNWHGFLTNGVLSIHR